MQALMIERTLVRVPALVALYFFITANGQLADNYEKIIGLKSHQNMIAKPDFKQF
jgi:hypothetical protein